MVERRHLPHVSSFRDNPIVFFTTCTHKRRKLLACTQSHIILRELWKRSAERDGWWVAHYILMPRSRSFLCASCNYRAANGEVDADVEERQLSRARGRVGYYATYLATGLL